EWLFYTLAIMALFAFRRRGERGPYRSWGYPVLPGIFVVLAVSLLVSTFRDNLHDSLLGLGVILLGIPFYFRWAARKARG
ncbi:MAG: amino acid transporter, partial [Terriglobales bacterium]